MRRWNESHLLHLHRILGWSQRSFHLHILSVGTRVVARCHQQHLLSRAGVCTACRPKLHVLFAPVVCVSSDLSSRVFRSVSFLLLLSTCVSFLVVHVWCLPSIPTAFFDALASPGVSSRSFLHGTRPLSPPDVVATSTRTHPEAARRSSSPIRVPKTTRNPRRRNHRPCSRREGGGTRPVLPLQRRNSLAGGRSIPCREETPLGILGRVVWERHRALHRSDGGGEVDVDAQLRVEDRNAKLEALETVRKGQEGSEAEHAVERNGGGREERGKVD